MAISPIQRRWGITLLIAGLIGVPAVFADGMLTIRRDHVQMLCYEEARDHPPAEGKVPSGPGEDYPSVHTTWSWFPYGIGCDYGTATVFKDLGTPGLVLSSMASLLGLGMCLFPRNEQARLARARKRQLESEARSADRRRREALKKTDHTWPPGGRVMG